MQRHKWNKIMRRNLIDPVLGGNRQPVELIASTYRGISEVDTRENGFPLSFMDQVMNRTESWAFAAGSWKAREDDPAFADQFLGSTIQDVVRAVYGRPLPSQQYSPGAPSVWAWINAGGRPEDRISVGLRVMYHDWNPFDHEYPLLDRLDALDADVVDGLVAGMRRPVKRYIFECQHDDLKREHEDQELEVMAFQGAYPEGRPTQIRNYAERLARMMGRGRYGQDLIIDARGEHGTVPTSYAREQPAEDTPIFQPLLIQV